VNDNAVFKRVPPGGQTLTGLEPVVTGGPGDSTRDGWPGPDADQAVAALHDEHYRSLVRIAALLTGESAVAEEIVQDAFACVRRSWRFLPGRDKALGDLRRAVVTMARSRSAASPAPPRRPGALPAAGRTAARTRGALVMAALPRLPARQREALVLRYYAQWPDRQIAAAMGISGRALNAHVRRGMSALRACLAHDCRD